MGSEGYKVILLNTNSPEFEPYKAFVISTWLKALRYGNDWFELIDQDIYFSIYNKGIERMLADANCQARLALLDIDVCLGYSIVSKDMLHFVYVKKDLRNQGIGRALVPQISQCSHITHIGKKILKKHKLKFNPFF